jgi:hypothetical protein
MIEKKPDFSIFARSSHTWAMEIKQRGWCFRSMVGIDGDRKNAGLAVEPSSS